MNTGERIKAARKAAGMTQTELADKIGVKYSAIHKYEAGLVVNLKRETIEALAIALNVRPSWLMCMDTESAATINLSSEEEQLIVLYRKADSIDQGTIWNILSRYDEEGSLSQASTG